MLQVVATFQRMRQEQRSMASKAAELEMEINEHRFSYQHFTSPALFNHQAYKITETDLPGCNTLFYFIYLYASFCKKNNQYKWLNTPD